MYIPLPIHIYMCVCARGACVCVVCAYARVGVCLCVCLSICQSVSIFPKLYYPQIIVKSFGLKFVSILFPREHHIELNVKRNIVIVL